MIKWMTSFIMWPAFGLDIALNASNGWPTDRTIRVFHVLGVLAVTMVLLVLIQPWQPDKPKSGE
jgi:hypothetical protein